MFNNQIDAAFYYFYFLKAYKYYRDITFYYDGWFGGKEFVDYLTNLGIKM